jgi:hypothetical protein
MSPLVGVLEKGHDAHLPTELGALGREDVGQKRAFPYAVLVAGENERFGIANLGPSASTQSFPISIVFDNAASQRLSTHFLIALSALATARWGRG